MSKRRARVWARIDAGKGHHWAAVVDDTGATLWSKKIDNDESAILAALGEILELADEVHGAVDISGTSSALLPALLAAHGQQAVYVPGRTVNRMADAYRGEAKTDARDAYVIAETACHRNDFAAIDVPAQLAADLALLTSHRTDLMADRVRMINRLRDVLTGIFPALERAFDYSSQKGPLVLLTGYRTPAAIRRRGRSRLTAWLANRGVRGADQVAATAPEAAQAQQTVLPGENVAAQIVAELADQILALDDRLKRVDKQIRDTFQSHPQAEIIESLPGMGPILGAEFVVPSAVDPGRAEQTRHRACSTVCGSTADGMGVGGGWWARSLTRDSSRPHHRGICCPAAVSSNVRHPNHSPDCGYSQFSASARRAGRSCFEMGGPG
ncbi:IS110 family transposase [Streptomyces sp. NPDC001165]|uniref:IS110 family transposase n=1 Tax=Streptomyces sp. NPDC001165 TaxID=3364546 RepID=UPI0036CB5124